MAKPVVKPSQASPMTAAARATLFGLKTNGLEYDEGKHEMTALRKLKGFTLVEVMVVVVTIGILAAVAIPTFSQYQKKSNDATALADAKNALVAVVASKR